MKYKKSVYRSFTLITQFGISMLVPIFICTFIGVYIGEKFSIPIIVIPLFIIGALAGFRNVYQIAKRIYEDKDENKEEDD
ncbi:AtpZ/AtpI family protein [Lachnospiraceae bacterium ZAX-1]